MSQNEDKLRPLPEINPNDYLCGIGSWRPQWMQRFATPKIFLFIFSTVSILQGAVYTYVVASMTTLERRYIFGSTVTGLILIADDVIELVTNPIAGFLANRVHRPRLIAFGYIIVVAGCFIAAAPYFIYGPAIHLLGQEFKNGTYEYCDDQRVDGDCSTGERETVVPVVIMLWIAGCCNGIGFTMYYIVGLPFIDDSVKKKNSPLYISTSAALRLCGPMIGFLLSSFCLQFYENPFYNVNISDRKDPRWVGAWWLGLIILGFAIFILTLPLFLFPKRFKQKKVLQKEIKVKIYRNESINSNGFWPSLKRVMSNPIFTCHVLGTIFRLFGILGFMTFKGKYIESQFRQSASTANFFSGATGVIPMVIGIFSGGLFIRQIKPKAKLLVTLMASAEFIANIALFAAMFLGCTPATIAGMTRNNEFSMHDTCNSDCQCNTRVFRPICADETTYFSPCFAGCKLGSLSKFDNFDNFTNCNCFSGVGVSGYCPNDCNNLAIYVTALGIANVIGSLARTGNSILAFRIVEERDKSFAAGISGFLCCLFAFIPYPLTFGAITDAACLIWEYSCGKKGNCWIYDTEKFRYYFHGSAIIFVTIGTFFDILVILLSGRIKNLYNDDVIETNDVNSCNENHENEILPLK